MKYILIIITMIVLVGVGYIVLTVGPLFYFMSSQMRTGQKYMDSLTEKDISMWIERTEGYMKEYDPNSYHIGAYCRGGDNPIPDELRELKIIRIDIFHDSVNYVWLGGLDHTYLIVEKNEQGDFTFTARYNDYNSKVIWPKEEDPGRPLESATEESQFP